MKEGDDDQIAGERTEEHAPEMDLVPGSREAKRRRILIRARRLRAVKEGEGGTMSGFVVAIKLALRSLRRR